MLRRVFFGVLVGCVGWCGVSMGQVVVGAVLSGVIRDQAGAVVVGARVEVQSVETGRVVVGVSDENGVYRVGPVPPGRYRVVVEAVGFRKATYEGVVLTVGQVATLNVTLSVGEVVEQVEVRGEGVAVVEPTKTEVSQVVDQVRITELPISGRQFIDFALLTPTTTVGKGVSFGASSPLLEEVPRLSFGGLFEQHTNFIGLDGGDHTVSLNGLQHAGPSQEAVREFRVLSSTYLVEYGRVMGGIVNIVTRSGGNEVGGVAYYYVRNDALDARNILFAPGLEEFRQHQFGASVGGPIRRDRLFYFGNYEGQRRAEAPLYTTFLLQNIGAINRVKRALGLGEELLQRMQTKDYDYVLVRGDAQVTARHSLFGRYSFADQRNENYPVMPGGIGAPSTFRENLVRSQSVMGNVTSLFGPSWVSQAFFQFSRKSFNNWPYPPVEPHIEIPNLAQFGAVVGSAAFYREQRFQFGETVSVLRGRHEVKAGVVVDHIRDDLLYSLTNPGYVIFTPESFFGLPPFGRSVPVLFVVNFVPGRPLPRRDPSRLFPNREYEEASRIKYTHEIFEFFLQDRWQRGAVTLSYGVRYFLEPYPSEWGMETDTNNVQPRVGLSWGFANGKGVVRAGAGIFVAPTFWSRPINHMSCVGGGPDFARLIDPALEDVTARGKPRCWTVNPPPGPFTSGPAFSRFVREGLWPTGPLARNAFTNATKDTVNAYAGQWSVQIEREVGGGISAGVGYLGVRGVKVMGCRQVNVEAVGRAPSGITLYRLKTTQVGIGHWCEPWVTSTYHGGFVTVSRRVSGGWGFTLNYTFSKTLDLPTGYTFRDVPHDPLAVRLDWGLSNQHVGQRVVVSFLGEGPRRWGVTRDFRLGVIVTAQSPRYTSIFTGFDVNGDLEWGPDRVGSIGRNTYRGDRFAQVDVRVSRRVGVTERVVVEPLIEFFNLFNRVNVSDVDTVYGAADFVGPVPQRYRDGRRGPLASFGAPALTGPARQVQIALRIHF
jgi:hypothetical protein